MKTGFLYFCYGLLLLLLYAVFTACIASSFWPPMRNGHLELEGQIVTISPFERTAIYCYVTAVVLVGAGVYYTAKSRIFHLWVALALTAILFVGTAFGLERCLHFDWQSHNWEKDEGIALIFGGLCSYIGLTTCASIIWIAAQLITQLVRPKQPM